MGVNHNQVDSDCQTHEQNTIQWANTCSVCDLCFCYLDTMMSLNTV